VIRPLISVVFAGVAAGVGVVAGASGAVVVVLMAAGLLRRIVPPRFAA
jgi:hypothetical protein